MLTVRLGSLGETVTVFVAGPMNDVLPEFPLSTRTVAVMLVPMPAVILVELGVITRGLQVLAAASARWGRSNVNEASVIAREIGFFMLLG